MSVLPYRQSPGSRSLPKFWPRCATTNASNVVYLDSSALVKIVVPEAESGALNQFLANYPQRISSQPARVEVVRAVVPQGPAAVLRAEGVLAGTVLLALNRSVLDVAARVTPLLLRSLDAIHLASALELGSDLEMLITYDNRLAAAAHEQNVAVAMPGRE